jgi:hypothetical protein
MTPANTVVDRLIRASLLADCLMREGLSKAEACRRAAREIEREEGSGSH